MIKPIFFFIIDSLTPFVDLYLKEKKILDLSFGKFRKLRMLPYDFSRLIELNLDYNELKQLPEDICNLSQLRSLFLSENQLKELPKSIGNLSQLTELDISRNQLKELPESIGNLSQLTSLDLGWNQLKELPESIGNLSQLTELDISVNQLKELPESIGNLSQLTKLDLRNNKLEELPKSIGNLLQLRWVALRHNELLTEKYGLSEDSYIEGDELDNLRLRLREQKKNQPKVVWSGSTYAISKDEYLKELSSVDGYKLYQEALIQKDAELFYKAGEKYDRSYNAINGDIIFSGCSKQEFASNFGIDIDYFDDNDFVSLLDKMQKFLVFSCHCYFKALEINPNHYMANLKLATALTTALKVPYAKFFWMKSLQLDQKGTIRAIVSDANGPGLKGFASKVIFLKFKDELDPQQVATAAMFAGNNHLNPNSNINQRLFMEQLSKAKNIFQADDYVTNKLEKMKEQYGIKDVGEGKN
ncbi:MAG: leucine-rich repeat domain-containing protein [Limnothrix sp.]